MIDTRKVLTFADRVLASSYNVLLELANESCHISPGVE